MSYYNDIDDIDEIKKQIKMKKSKTKKIVSKVTVNLGDEEYNFGKNKITPEIFDGKDREENA